MGWGLKVAVKFGSLGIGQAAEECGLAGRVGDGLESVKDRGWLRVTLGCHLLRLGGSAVVFCGSFLGRLGFGFELRYFGVGFGTSGIRSGKLLLRVGEVGFQFFIGVLS